MISLLLGRSHDLALAIDEVAKARGFLDSERTVGCELLASRLRGVSDANICRPRLSVLY